MPKVSIIIPVYNAEQYIAKTVESILNQDFQDWELILVDDCSTDNTNAICRRLVEKNNRIRYIRQPENRGPSVARNSGIDSASGKYLAFVDSDDIIEKHYLRTLITAADTNEADVVWCNYYEDFATRSLTKLHHLPTHIISDKKAVGLFLSGGRAGLGSMCNKLYRRDFVESHHCRLNPNRVHGEDWEFNLTVFRHGAKILPISDCLYHYIRQNASSVIASYRPFDYDTYVYSLKLLDEVANEFGISYNHSQMYSNHIYMVIALLVCLMKSNYPEKRKEFSRIVNDEHFTTILSSGQYQLSSLPVRYRMYFILMKFRLNSLAYYLISLT